MNKWVLAFLYLLVFVLLREWLLPIIELTETSFLSLFLLFIGLAFLLALIGVKWWLSIPLKLFFVLWATYYIYTGLMVVEMGLMKLIFNDLVSNIPMIMNGDWERITNPFRTVLFFLILWMATYLIRYWIEVRKSVFLFYFMTLVFIAVMDTFSTYSAEGSIFTVMVIGLLLLGVLTILRVFGKHNKPISRRTFMAIFMPLILVIVAGSVFTVAFPKQEAILGDYMPFIKKMTDETVDEQIYEGVAKSGYSPDDSQLGGPFTVDDSLVFEAVVDKKQYWKIETKDTYTSKGWEQSDIGKEVFIYYPGMEMGESNDDKGIESSEIKEAGLTMTEKFPFIIYPYGMTTVTTEQDILILNSAVSREYRTVMENKEHALDAYTIEYTERQYSLKALRETRIDSLQVEGLREYLQLPDTLPDRVAELAESITASSESVYDKAKAIERYYGSAGFVYDRTDVSVPDEHEDYVDQFLFETQKGYCDNFSTSMVVMLRTLDIPARWVKGFAPGEAAKNENGERIYQVTNKEAHSWVEAYMPGIGWLPFEPTIGFNGMTSIDYDIEMDRNDPQISEMPKKEREKIVKDTKKDVKQEPRTAGRFWETAATLLKENWHWVLIIGIGLLLVAWRGIKRRGFSSPTVRFSQSEGGSWASYSAQYQHLLQQLGRLGLKRAAGETLSAYAVRVDNELGDDLMQKLTIAYEEGIYGGNKESQDWQRLQEMWKDLINRTSD